MGYKQPHIELEEVDKVCFLSGNPDRVPNIAKHLKNSQEIARHRGLVAYGGQTPTKEINVTVLSTGMGCPSNAIVLEEAYRAGARIFIRIGSTGSLLPGPDNGIGTIFIPFAAIRDDGVSPRLVPIEFPAVANPIIYQKLVQAAKELDIHFHSGIVWSTDIYYSTDPYKFRQWSKYGANCVEMESSTLFTFPALKDEKVMVGTILTSDGNLEDKTNIYSGDIKKNIDLFNKGVQNTIKCAIKAIELL
ncbi:MAG: nucleoside phosphorylase [Candidatus Hodarchaeales archaeon]